MLILFLDLTLENQLRDLASFKFIKNIFPDLEQAQILDWVIWKVLRKECEDRMKDWELSGNRVNVVTKLFNSEMLIKRIDEIDDPVFVLSGHHSSRKKSIIVVKLKQFLSGTEHTKLINDYELSTCAEDDDNMRANKQLPAQNTQSLSIIANMQMTLGSFFDNILVCCGLVENKFFAKTVQKHIEGARTHLMKNQIAKLDYIQISLSYSMVAKTLYGANEVLEEILNEGNDEGNFFKGVCVCACA